MSDLSAASCVFTLYLDLLAWISHTLHKVLSAPNEEKKKKEAGGARKETKLSAPGAGRTIAFIREFHAARAQLLNATANAAAVAAELTEQLKEMANGIDQWANEMRDSLWKY